ncbi:osteocalcin-like isoform 1-T1 [Anomaloglossus baeobatrachus]|uniref:osteocalcin-like isoform X2 n=1 Tax=Anomaloglossus baeobatrachus TaxID=238106 RepID=UPI003F4FDF1E
MKTLMVLSLLGIMAGCLALEATGDKPPDGNSKKLLNDQDVVMSRSAANSVIKRHRRSYDYLERLFPRIKSPLERKMEQCEDYWPCDQMSESVGFYKAYQRYFGRV